MRMLDSEETFTERDGEDAVVVSLDDVRAVEPPPRAAAEGFEAPLLPEQVFKGLLCTSWMPALNKHVRATVTDAASASAPDDEHQ